MQRAFFAMTVCVLLAGCGEAKTGPVVEPSASVQSDSDARADSDAPAGSEPADGEEEREAEGGGDPDADLPRNRKPTGVGGVHDGVFVGRARHGGSVRVTVAGQQITALSVTACGQQSRAPGPVAIHGTQFTSVVGGVVTSGVFVGPDRVQGAVQVPSSCSTTYSASR